MIVDAPLKFPADRSYKILGDTGNTRFLSHILAKLRPDANFMGVTDNPADREADILIVCDLAVEGAEALIHDRDASDVAIFPLPVGDVWGYWSFSAVSLDKLRIGDEVAMTNDDFVNILERYGRLEEDPSSGKMALRISNYLIANKGYIGSCKDEILEVMQALSDEQSRARYSNVLIGEPEAHWANYLSRAYQNIQYFDYLDFNRCEVVLNGGVFGGYELPFFVTHLPKGAVVHNFDPLGHSHLTDYVRPWVESGIINFVDNQVALDKADGSIDMSVLGDGQVKQDARGADDPEVTTYPSRSIDSFVEENQLDRVDLIKFDLEGGDQNAVRGSLKTIAKFRPQLALSIYHAASDFWEIPQMIIDTVPDYNYYLDTYSFERWETILYAIPKEFGPRQTNVI